MCLEAYFAGMLDGEGTVTVYQDRRKRTLNHQRPSFQLTVSICGNVPEPFYLMEQEYGGHISSRVKGTVYKGETLRYRTPTYQIRWNGEQAQNFLQAIQPWVVIKAQHVSLALEYPILGPRGNLPLHDEARAEQERVYEAVRDLNAKVSGEPV